MAPGSEMTDTALPSWCRAQVKLLANVQVEEAEREEAQLGSPRVRSNELALQMD